MLYYISKFLWHLIVTGFPKDCEHEYNKWEKYTEVFVSTTYKNNSKLYMFKM